MPQTFNVPLTEDEIGILVDALEADQEGYVEAAKEARANNKRDDVETFTSAAMNIQTLMGRLQDLIGDGEDADDDAD